VGDQLTLIDDGTVVELPARFRGDGVRLRPADVQRALGWELKPEGLCQGSLCVPVRNAAELATADGIDLSMRGAVATVGVGRRRARRVSGRIGGREGAQLATCRHPTSRCPISGRMHSLSDYRGRKILLIAYASWQAARYDLPVWQALTRAEGSNYRHHRRLDQNTDDPRSFIGAAPTHQA
jgi:hypothetical protein